MFKFKAYSSNFIFNVRFFLRSSIRNTCVFKNLDYQKIKGKINNKSIEVINMDFECSLKNLNQRAQNYKIINDFYRNHPKVIKILKYT